MWKYVVMAGDKFFTAFGPFDDEDTAGAWAKKNLPLHTKWRVMFIRKPW